MSASAKPSSAFKPNGLNIVICGGGIIGVCTAYYLSQRDNVSSITIIERYKIAGCASGKAGGFLALDWCDDGWLRPLARKSFELHTELGQKYGDRYLYRPTIAYSVKSTYSKDAFQHKQKPKYTDLQWLNSSNCAITKQSALGSKQTNAQLHPRLFCETLVDLMHKTGKLAIKNGIVSKIIFDKSDKCKAVGVGFIPNGSNNDECVEILCDDVVIAMGPWSKQSFEWFPRCKCLKHITGSKANSIVIQPDFGGNDDEKKENDAVQSLDGQLFLLHVNANGKLLDIDVYPRPDGSVYSCCISKQVKLPDDPSHILHEESDSQKLFGALKELSEYTKNAKLVTKQACYLPSALDGVPLIGQITGYKNAYIGAGHTCWGILNGPATGLLLTELIVDGKVSSVKQSEFDRWDPARTW